MSETRIVIRKRSDERGRRWIVLCPAEAVGAGWPASQWFYFHGSALRYARLVVIVCARNRRRPLRWLGTD